MIHQTFKFPRIDAKSSFYFSDGKGWVFLLQHSYL